MIGNETNFAIITHKHEHGTADFATVEIPYTANTLASCVQLVQSVGWETI